MFVYSYVKDIFYVITTQNECYSNNYLRFKIVNVNILKNKQNVKENFLKHLFIFVFWVRGYFLRGKNYGSYSPNFNLKNFS